MISHSIGACFALLTFSGVAASFSSVLIGGVTGYYSYPIFFVSIMYWGATLSNLLYLATQKAKLFNLGFDLLLVATSVMVIYAVRSLVSALYNEWRLPQRFR